MTSCFNPHFSCTQNWSQVFETNTAGQQSIPERLFLKAIFTNGSNALAGKGLTWLGLYSYTRLYMKFTKTAATPPRTVLKLDGHTGIDTSYTYVLQFVQNKSLMKSNQDRSITERERERERERESCLLNTSPSPRDRTTSRMPSSA